MDRQHLREVHHVPGRLRPRVVEDSLTRYVAERLLAAGGTAEIYVARQEGEGGVSREVAVKRVVSHLSDDDDFAAMFTREARVLSRLSHPNLVQIYDFDRDGDGRLFLAMELVHGEDLSVLLARMRHRGKRLASTVAVHIAERILEALTYVHGEGLVHRDVTPHNVLIAFDGAVKLADFGIVKASATTTQTRSIRGKLAYMSPEQALGQRVDHRSDLFAVGVILFEMLTGQRPFAGSTFEVLGQIAHQAPFPLHDLEVQVSVPLSRIVDRLLQKSARRRFGSAEEALQTLHGTAEHDPAGAPLLAQLFQRPGEEGAPNPAPAVIPIALPNDRTRTVLSRARKPLRWGLVMLLLAVAASTSLFLLAGRERAGGNLNDPQSAHYLRDYPVKWSDERFASPGDIVGYAPKVEALARRAIPGATLVSLLAGDVDAAGFMLPTARSAIWYFFKTPLDNATHLSIFAIAIMPDGLFFYAGNPLNGEAWGVTGSIRCPFPDIWARTGLGAAAHARVNLSKPPWLATRMWTISTTDKIFTIPDDCN